MLIDKDELLEALARVYGDISSEGGCSVLTDEGWVWLSLKNIVSIINSCEIYD